MPAVLLAIIVLLLMPASAAGQAERPSNRQLYEDGHAGRYLLDGTWLYRADKGNVGLRDGYARNPSTAGWTRTTVPNAWNQGDDSVESMTGTQSWYRRDFRLPSSSRRLDWVIRFESVNYRARIWLNGQRIGTNRGAYLPFELRLPGLRRTGVNRLVLRIDNRRFGGDFPPSGLTRTNTPTGGWWNYGGILREVYLRKIDRVDFTQVQVRPILPCATCAATIQFAVTARNYGDRAVRVRLSGRYGTRRVRLGTASIGARRFHRFARSIRIARPRLWSPAQPSLYRVRIDARAGGRRLHSFALHSGIRSVKVVDGRLLLNGKPMNFRGVGLHEDTRAKGLAIDPADRALLAQQAKEIGATVIRSHYPLHPHFHELADRLGLFIASEIPVYAIKTQYLRQRLVRQLAANELRDNILENQNHPSVLWWSIGNELSARPGPVQGFYIRRAARTAHQLDPTRPVALAVAAYPSAGCQPEYEPLDVIGLNEYFGWYPGPNGQIADRTALSEYLDGVRACYPRKALVISEFGAEANRDGPVEEKGTYAHQQDFVRFHLGVYASKPWLSGAIYWALREFRVRPGWEGGNPRPEPPIHQKGLLTYDNGKKPAWTDAQQLFRSVRQFG